MNIVQESTLGGHLSIKKTRGKIQNQFWPKMMEDITMFYHSCDVYQRTIPKGKVTRTPLVKVLLVDIPLTSKERWSIMLLGN